MRRVAAVVFRYCVRRGSASVVVLILGNWCALAGVSWVLGIGFVIVVGVGWRWGVGGRSFVGRTCYFVRLSASLVRRDMVSLAFLSESSAWRVLLAMFDSMDASLAFVA